MAVVAGYSFFTAYFRHILFTGPGTTQGLMKVTALFALAPSVRVQVATDNLGLGHVGLLTSHNFASGGRIKITAPDP